MGVGMSYGRRSALAKMGLGVFLLAAGPLAAEEEVELLALGDSLTEGYGLPVDEGFVPQLEAWLRAEGHAVKVINGGVSGDTTTGGLNRLEWSLTDQTSAMIVALGGNDFLRGIDPSFSRSNIESILKIAADRDLPVLLVGMQAPGNYGPDYKQSFDAIYPELSEEYGTDFAPSFFEGLGLDETNLAEVQKYMQRDGIHPNAQGVVKIVDALGPRVAALLGQVAASQ